MHLSTLNVVNGVNLNIFDGVLIAWLILGLFRGRKNGMSVELLHLVQWLLIVVVCSYTYHPIGDVITHTFLFITQLWAYLLSYVLVAMLISAVFGKISQATESKLVAGDFFGKKEYYLGMLAGVLRFACMAFMFMALVNSHIISKAEREATAQMQKKNFESISFPTFGSIQQAILFDSYTGRTVRDYTGNLLIAPVAYYTPTPASGESLGIKKQRALDEITGPSTK